LSGGTAVCIDTQKQGFKLTPKVLESHIDKHTKALILNYPSNPTGVTYTKKELSEINRILLKHKEDAERGVIVKPSDSSRYFPGGKRKAKRNIRTRFGINYKAPGTFLTGTYDHEQYSRWEAWLRLQEDLNRFKHDIYMRYLRE
jgi:hypothetical protein